MKQCVQSLTHWSRDYGILKIKRASIALANKVSETEQQEPTTDQHEPEQEHQEPESDQQEPEPEQKSRLETRREKNAATLKALFAQLNK